MTTGVAQRSAEKTVAVFRHSGANGAAWSAGWLERGYTLGTKGAASSATFTQQTAKGRARIIRATGDSGVVGTMYRPFTSPVTGGKVLDYRSTLRLPKNSGNDAWVNIVFSNNQFVESDSQAAGIFLRISPFGTRFVTRVNNTVASTANVTNPPGATDLEVRFRFDQAARKAYARWWRVGTAEPRTWQLTSTPTGVDGSKRTVGFLRESAWATIKGIGYMVSDAGVVGTHDTIIGPLTVTT